MKREKKKKIVAWVLAILFAVNILAMLLPVLFVRAEQGMVKVEVNGKAITSDVAPFIVNDRTVVPVRMVFEAVNAQVSWDEREQKVSVATDESNIDFFIGSKIAYLNQTPHELDAAAMISQDRTFVPLRFLAESCGFAVFWIDETKTVKLYNKISGNNTFEKIVFSKDKLTLSFGSPTINYQRSLLENPKRLVLDISSCINQVEQYRAPENPYFSTLRFSQFTVDPFVTRVVLELKEDAQYKINKEGTQLVIQFSQQEEDEDPKPTMKPDEKPKVGKRVVIDAGHGGKDPGAVGKENGIIVLKEKDVNFEIASKVYDLLVKQGVDVHITKKTNEFLELIEIANIANNLEADYFVSIHNNASENTNVRGTMTLYAYDDPKPGHTLSGKEFAQIIQKHMAKEIGVRDIGIVKNPALAVVRRTTMPAVITESLFVSNSEDRTLLLDQAVRSRIAQSICDGIMEVLSLE